MYGTDLDIEWDELEPVSDESPEEEKTKKPVPSQLDARRLIERRLELKRLHKLLDDPFQESDELAAL